MSKKISIGFFGDGKWALNSLKLILKKKNYLIKFICTRYDFPDLTLISFCKKNNIKLLKFRNVNDLLSIKEIQSHRLDMIVSMSYNQIFKKKLIGYFKFGIINCHASYLPFYRGRSPLNWVLIKDEKFFGITVHYVNQGIDKGDIIMQKKFKITNKDNFKTILNKAYKNCPKLLIKAIYLVVNKKDKPIKQDSINKQGSYYRKRINGDEIINWKGSAREIFCFVRGLCKPGVMATTYFKNNKILINESDPKFITMKKNSNLGEIIKVSNNYFLVQTKDFVIKIKKWYGKIEKGMILN